MLSETVEVNLREWGVIPRSLHASSASISFKLLSFITKTPWRRRGLLKARSSGLNLEKNYSHSNKTNKYEIQNFEIYEMFKENQKNQKSKKMY